MSGLGVIHLRLALADCLRNPDHHARSLEAISGKLWREDHCHVAAAYDAMIFGSLDVPREGGCHGLLATRMRELHKPLPSRDKQGVTLNAIAEGAGMDRLLLATLMEHHGYLELVPFGGTQKRRLVTDEAFRAGIGHNVDPGAARSRRVDGMNRSIVFPVFYPEMVAGILWTLDWDGIRRAARGVSNKRNRMKWMLERHGYLPDQAIADATLFSLRGVKKARATLKSIGKHHDQPPPASNALCNFQGHFQGNPRL